MVEKISGSHLIARALKAEGVDSVFGLFGGEMFGLLNVWGEMGMNVFHMRSERNAGYAADAYARCLRKPGVCFAGGAPGFCDLVSPLYEAKSGFGPVIGLVTQQSLAEEGLNGFQEGYANELFKGLTKWSKLVSDWHTQSYWIKKAFRDVMLYPQGPVVLSFPTNILMGRDFENRQLMTGSYPKTTNTMGEQHSVEDAVDMLISAKSPLVVTGEGVYWAHAEPELNELINLLNLPVNTRRISRGSVPENHRLSVSGAGRNFVLKEADLVLIIGLTANYLEDWFLPPLWNSQKTKYIQIQESEDSFFVNPETEIGITGNIKLVLRQMLHYALSKQELIPSRNEIKEAISQLSTGVDNTLRKISDGFKDEDVIDAEYLAQEITDFLDDDATYILDSVTMSACISDRIKTRFAGQILEYPLHQPIGHSVGAAVGAQVARPGKQVISLIGDGGMGIGGWDLETMIRYKLPAVVLVYNNSCFAGNPIPWIPKADFLGLTPGTRYDKLSEVFGCHGEHITKPNEIRPALDRAFSSGKPAVINAVGQILPRPPEFLSNNTFMTRLAAWTVWSLNNKDQLDDKLKDNLRVMSPQAFKRILNSFQMYGLWISEEELAESIGYHLDEKEQSN